MAYPWNDKQNEIIREGWLSWPYKRLNEALNAANATTRTFTRGTLVAQAQRLGMPPRTYEVSMAIHAAHHDRSFVPRVWTAERERLLREIYAKDISDDVGLGMLNNLPGPEVRPNGMRRHAVAMKLKRKRKERSDKGQPKAAKLEKVRIYEDPRGNNFLWSDVVSVDFHVMDSDAEDTAHAKRIAKLERAREMLRRKKDPSSVGEATGLPMREVFRLVGEVREEARAMRRAG